MPQLRSIDLDFGGTPFTEQLVVDCLRAWHQKDMDRLHLGINLADLGTSGQPGPLLQAFESLQIQDKKLLNFWLAAPKLNF